MLQRGLTCLKNVRYSAPRRLAGTAAGGHDKETMRLLAAALLLCLLTSCSPPGHGITVNGTASGLLLTPDSRSAASANLASLQHALSNLADNGGVVSIPAGVYYFSGTLTLTTTVTLQGAGSGAVAPNYGASGSRDRSGTQLVELDDAVPFVVVAADACIIQNLRLSCGYNDNPSPGSAGISTTSNACTEVHLGNVFIDGFYLGIDRQYGRYWTVDGATLYNNTRAGLQIQDKDAPDEGDDIVTKCLFLGGSPYQADGVTQTRVTPYAGVIWNSAGGLKLVNNKFNTGLINTPGNFTVLDYNLVLRPAGGVATGEFTITDNSFGYFNKDGILVDLTADGSAEISKMNVANNIFLWNANSGTAGGCYALRVMARRNGAANPNNYLAWLDLTGNQVSGGAGLAYLEAVAGGNIGSNIVAQPFAAPAIYLGAGNFDAIGLQNNDTPRAPFDSGTGASRVPNIVYSQSTDFNAPSLFDSTLEVTTNRNGRDGSAPIAAVSGVGTASLVFTLGNPHFGNPGGAFGFRAGDLVYLAGVAGVTGNVNNSYASVTAVSGNKVTVQVPGGTGGSYSGGGYLSAAGSWFELLLQDGQPVNLGLEITATFQGADASNGYAVGSRLQRTLVQHAGLLYLSAQGQDSATSGSGTPCIAPGGATNPGVRPTASYGPASALISDPVITDAPSATQPTVSVSGTVVLLPSTAGVAVGQAVYGAGIQPGTTVASLAPNSSLTLSQPALSTTGTTLSFSDGSRGNGFEVLLEGTYQLGQLPGSFTSSGKVVSQQNGGLDPNGQGALRQVNVGDFVRAGTAYGVTGVSGVGTGALLLTLSPFPTPFFKAGDTVFLSGSGGIANFACNEGVGDFGKTILSVNPAAHQITIDGSNSAGSYRGGSTVSQLRRVLDVIDNWRFTTDTAFSPALSGAALTSAVDDFGVTKVRIIVRPVNSSGAMTAKVRLSLQGNPYQVSSSSDQP